MPGRGAHTRKEYRLDILSLSIITVISLASLAAAAENLCEPGFVRRPESDLRALPVSAVHPDTIPRPVRIQWLGHSSFLIITPAGTTALTDPHPGHASPTVPDIVTISNEHPTHNYARSAPGSAQVLRGRTPTGDRVE